MRSTTYFDSDGIERHTASNRKVRKDRGSVRRHPSDCLHCEMVNEYRIYRENEIEAQGGWRNERPTVRYGLIAWQSMWYLSHRQLNPDITSEEPWSVTQKLPNSMASESAVDRLDDAWWVSTYPVRI